jgi:branched-subunit amino acid ABC-type transport system permease component
MQVAGLVIPPARAAALGLLVLSSLGLAVFLRVNRWGRALRAWDQGRGFLWTVGVDPAGLGRRLMAFCGAVAGLAGGLLCLGHTVSIQDGMAMTMRCLCVAAAAGPRGSMPVMGAGLGLGLAEALVGHCLGTQWMALVPYALVILILTLREIKRPWPFFS